MEKAEKRGRPKTLEREHVLQTALMQYWGCQPDRRFHRRDLQIDRRVKTRNLPRVWKR